MTQIDTLVDLFESAVDAHGDTEAIVAGADRLTFAEWWSRAGGVALALQDRGVGKGDVVALLLPTSIDYAVLYIAAVRLGAVTTGLNPRLGPHEVAAMLDLARPALVVCDSDTRALVPPSAIGSVVDVTTICDAPPADVPSPGGSSDDPVAIVWTSGTSGTPKGAWYDHAALRGTAESVGELTLMGDRRLVPLPFQHAGFMTRPWELVAWANTIVLSPTPWSAATMLRQLVDERITVGVGVPTQWEKLLALPDFDRTDLSALRIAVTTTAPAAPELVRAMQARLGCGVLVRYATTETAFGTGTRTGDPPEAIFATVGRALEGASVRVVDPAGEVVPDGAVGEVELRTRGQMRGYWRDEARTKETITPDGWIRTRDLGTIRDDGNLVLLGRSTDLYIRGGYNVYPLEVENVLGLHPKVAEVAVVGTPAPVIGEIGVAVVVPADPSDPPSLDELRSYAQQRIADYKAPDRLVVVDQLPRNATHKVSRPALRALITD